MKKKTIINAAIVLFVIVVITPVLVNCLMLWHLPSRWVNQNNQWVGFFSSYLGGILGGIISGALTLGGVYLTIQEQRRKDYIDSYPEKMINGDEIYSVLEKVEKFEEYFKDNRMGIVTGDCTGISKNEKDLLLKASKINGQIYVLTKNVIKDVDNLLKIKDKMQKQGLPICHKKKGLHPNGFRFLSQKVYLPLKM